MRTIFLALVVAFAGVSCSSMNVNQDESIAEGAGAAKDRKIVLEASDIVIEDGMVSLPLNLKCIEGQESVVLQIGDFYKAFKCSAGLVNYTYKFPVAELKKNRDKKKDYVVRVRAYRSDAKEKTLAQLLAVISYKDYQTKLIINQNLLTIEGMEGIFSDLSAHGQCASGSAVEIEVFDDFRGVSLEESNQECSDTGFAFFSRKPGVVKKGMRLLIRQIKNEKAVASYEVVLFN